MPANKPTAGFPPVFARLKKILAAHVPPLVVARDTPTEYLVNTTRLHPTNGQPLCFGMVRTGRNYVSFHLMPVYASPALQAAISPALKKRMQGKACFNFAELDEPLFAELATLTTHGREAFRTISFAKPKDPPGLREHDRSSRLSPDR